MARDGDDFPDIVAYTLDAAGRVASWNRKAQALHGYGAPEVIGRPLTMFYEGHGNVGDDCSPEARSIAEQAGKHEVQVRRLRKDGSCFETKAMIQPLRDRSDRLIGFTQMLYVPRERLNGQDIPRSALSFAHEYNNALFSITGGLELLRRRVPPDDRTSGELFELIRRQLDKAKTLTFQLVDASGSDDYPDQASAPKEKASESKDPPPEIELSGLRVLVVEDEALVRILIEDYLNQLECQLVGVAPTVEKGLAMAARDDIDIALLDWNLQGKPVEPVAQELSNRGVPFVFISGSMSASWNSRPTIRKPFDVETLRREMARAISAARQAS
jgi:PAS domain S-box-containing protein